MGGRNKGDEYKQKLTSMQVSRDSDLPSSSRVGMPSVLHLSPITLHFTSNLPLRISLLTICKVQGAWVQKIGGRGSAGDVPNFSQGVSSFYSPNMQFYHDPAGTLTLPFFNSPLLFFLLICITDTGAYTLKFLGFVKVDQAGQYYFAVLSSPISNAAASPSDILCFLYFCFLLFFGFIDVW